MDDIRERVATRPNGPVRIVRGLLALCAALAWSSSGGALLYDADVLDFSSTGQSIWGTGAGFRKSETRFVGPEWRNQRVTFGEIKGDVSTTTINTNPLWAVWWTCKNTVNVLCGDEPDPKPRTIRVDTRNGATLTLQSSGKVGLEFGYSIDSGTVDSQVQFEALADLPQQPVEKATPIMLNTDSVLDGGVLETRSPKVEAYIAAVMQLSGSIDATACANIPAVIGGCASGSTSLPGVDMNQRILSVDANSLKVLDGVLPGDKPFAELALANQSLTLEAGATAAPPALGFKLTGPLGITLASSLPPTPSITADLASIEVQVPDIATRGGKSGRDRLASSGRDDFISAALDLDGAATIFGGLPPLGLNATLIDVAGFQVGASLDLIDADAGPVLGVTQGFELRPTLMVDLAFSNPVEIAGLAGPQSAWSGRWSDLPAFMLQETTTFTPTFWLESFFTNRFGLDLGLSGTWDLLKLGGSATAAGFKLLDIGPISLNGLLGFSSSLFDTPKAGFDVYEDTFALGGFDAIQAASFTIAVRRQGANAGIPEAGIAWLLAGGLLLWSGMRRRAPMAT